MTILRTAYRDAIDTTGHRLANAEFVSRNGRVELEMIWVRENGPEITEDDIPY